MLSQLTETIAQATQKVCDAENGSIEAARRTNWTEINVVGEALADELVDEYSS